MHGGTYINGSLRHLITAGKGNPNPKEDEEPWYTAGMEEWTPAV